MKGMCRIGGKLRKWLEWLRAFRQWLGKLLAFRLLLFTAVVIPAAVVIAAFLGTEAAFRLIGLGLQILGIGAVAINIFKAQTQFGEPSLFGFYQFLREFPRLNPRSPISAGLTQLQGDSTLDAKAYTWRDVASDAYIEIRLDGVEKKLDTLKQILDEFREKTDKTLAFHSEILDQERQDRTYYDNKIQGGLKGLAVGGLKLSAAGLVWLFVGTVMSTAPTELRDLFAIRAAAPLQLHLHAYQLP